MKAKSVSLLLLHYEPGTHREVTRWHEEVHRREMHASVPHMYYSQDWVAPPGHVQARPPTELGAQGGEYATMYFSAGGASELNADVRSYAEQTRGNFHPYQEVIWRGRMDITSAQARAGWELTLDTVPLFANVGLAVQIDELAEPDSAAYTAWSQQLYIPELLRSAALSGIFQMKPIGPDSAKVRVHLLFVERGDPLETFDIVKGRQARTASLYRTVFLGIYVPVTPENYDTYD